MKKEIIFLILLVAGTCLFCGCISQSQSPSLESTVTPVPTPPKQGSWLELEPRAEVVGFTTDQQADAFITNLSKQLNAEVVMAGPAYPGQLEIRKYYSQAELEPTFEREGGKITSYQSGISNSTADLVKHILENKIEILGSRDAKVGLLTSTNNITQYIQVELPGVDMKQAQEIVGKQGKFEIRIKTNGNQTEHVLSQDEITSVQIPSEQPPGSDNWGVAFNLSESGAEAFRTAMIKYGAIAEPPKHFVIMLLDNNTVYSAPLSVALAGELQNKTINRLYASTGTGNIGEDEATNLEIHLRAGALPVDLAITDSGNITSPSAA